MSFFAQIITYENISGQKHCKVFSFKGKNYGLNLIRDLK